MHRDFARLMQEATRLTRGGDLQAATAAIQTALRGAAAPASPAGDVIDVEARVVPETSAGMLADSPPTAREERAAEASPRPESFTAGRFGSGGSARDYMLYVPPGAGAQPLSLVVMLHGCTQDPADFAAGTAMNALAREQGCLVLYPAQSKKANPQGCWNWFKHSHQERGRGEPAIIAGMVKDVMSRHAVDPARVYVAGLSAGGAMAAILGDAYPDLFAAVGVHSGLGAGSARDLPSALAAMKNGAVSSRKTGKEVPTIVFHGDADTTVHPENARHVIRAATSTAAAETQRGANFTRALHRDASGREIAEHWVVHGSGHAWSGGCRRGSYTDPSGPDASREMLRFFLEHPRAAEGG